MSRRKIKLNKNDQAIWKKVTETVEPLSPDRDRMPVLENTGQHAKINPGMTKTETKKSGKTPAVTVKKNPGPRPRPHIQASANHLFDHKTVRRISKGKFSIDGRIDLHGLTQPQAIIALRRFIHMAHASDFRLVLVITGKGLPEHGQEGRGILRQRVPDWLTTGELAPMVSGVREANPLHGGSGALYVRLRRAKN